MIVDLTDEERELLKYLSKDINRTAYHGGIGERAVRYIALLDKLIGEPGWEQRLPSAAEIELGQPGGANIILALDPGTRHLGSADADEFRTAVESIVRARVASVAGWDGFSPGSVERMIQDIATAVTNAVGPGD